MSDRIEIVEAKSPPRETGMNRRAFLGTSLLGAAALTQSCVSPSTSSRRKKLTLAAAFDPEVEAFMAARKVPGGALAVVKDRRLVYARGYGWADRDAEIPAKPVSLFRIASISKPITAVAVMKLAEQGRLSLDDRALGLLKLEPLPRDNGHVERRLARITIRQLLQHTGGWDRDKSFDPMFRPVEIAKAVGAPAPAEAAAVIQYMLRQPLDFDPGTRYAYSNFGYCLLGRIIEKITGRPYHTFVREAILSPIGIKKMRLGASLDGQQAEDEVRYYMSTEGTTSSVFPSRTGQVPWPYGGFHLEAMDAHGGWIASAVDLARFAAALDDPTRSPLLKRQSLEIMSAPPPPPVSRRSDGSLEHRYYACGWMVRPFGLKGRASYWHSGSLPGTATLLVRRWDGVSWAVLFNQRSAKDDLPDGAIDPALHRAADSVAEWPKHDLFAQL
jgi:N-acyl-D-amino-acid deacylase